MPFNPEGKTIAVVRLSAFGDILHTLPAVQLLSESFPDSRIHWISSSRGRELLRCFQTSLEIQTIDFRKKSLGRSLSELFRIRSENRGRFDLVADFQGLIKSALVARACGGRVLGFHGSNLRERPAACFYSLQAQPFPEHAHVVQKNIHLLSAMGVSAHGPVVFPPLKIDGWTAPIRLFMKGHSLERKAFSLLNVGGGWPTKVLPFKTMAELVPIIQRDFPVLLLWGTVQERELARELSTVSGAIICPETDFKGLLSLVSGSRLVISGDTLALHAADAVGVPSVGFFGPTSPARNGSLLPGSRAVVTPDSCRFCYRRSCDTMRCMSEITPSSIAEAVAEVLNASG